MFETHDNAEVSARILKLSISEASELGIGKSTLHYLRRNARDSRTFRLYRKVYEMIQASMNG